MMEPPTRYTAMMTTMIRNFGTGREAVQLAAIMGISVIARKCPKMEDPAINMSVIMEVLKDPRKEATSIFELISLLTKARRKTATVPMVPASVGLKKPVI